MGNGEQKDNKKCKEQEQEQEQDNGSHD